MEYDRLRALLEEYQSGHHSLEDVMDQLKRLPYEEVDGFAHLDHHRSLRTGFPEVIFAQGKTPEQVAEIFLRLKARARQVLATRVSPEMAAQIQNQIPEIRHHPAARALFFDADPDREKQPGILVVTAGTSDIPVAEEAALTAELAGNEVERIFDVGVAGLHRLLGHMPGLQKARVIIAVAGMEGALPSVIAGLVSAPIVAVPTSIGYGASFQGLAALLGMLNSCAGGVSVVNIDNGFGAGVIAAKINRLSFPGLGHESR